jgi:general secretion pathway protein D
MLRVIYLSVDNYKKQNILYTLKKRKGYTRSLCASNAYIKARSCSSSSSKVFATFFAALFVAELSALSVKNLRFTNLEIFTTSCIAEESEQQEEIAPNSSPQLLTAEDSAPQNRAYPNPETFRSYIQNAQAKVQAKAASPSIPAKQNTSSSQEKKPEEKKNSAPAATSSATPSSIAPIQTLTPASSPNNAFQNNSGQNDTQDAASEINVKNAELATIIRIFSKRTKRNYLLDERVKGKVAMYLPGKLNPEESIKILDSILSLKGFTSVPIGDNFWKVIPSREAKQSTVPTLTQESEQMRSAAVVTKLIQLKHLASQEIEPLITQLISPDGLVNGSVSTNSVIVIDYENNIERISKIVESVDVPYSERDMTMIPIKHASAKDIAEKLKELLGDPSAKKGDSSELDTLRNRFGNPQNNFQQPQTMPQTSGGMQNTRFGGQNKPYRTKEPKIIADERTNSIILFADDETTARIKALISELDSKMDLSGNRFYVYRCQHANAEDLAQVLSGLIGGGGGSGQTGQNQRGQGSQSNLNSSRGRNSLRGGNNNQQSGGLGSRGGGLNDGTGGGGGQGGQNQGPTTVNLGDNVSITADPATNSIIINADKPDYEKIKSLIDELDIKRRQVLVEAMLLEVSVTNSSSLGTEFITSTGGADGGLFASNRPGGSQNLTNLLSNPSQLSDFSIAAASSGTLTLPRGIVIPSQSILLNAAQSNSNVNVLSAPTLLATDNEQAEIVVGQNIPFLASTSADATNLNNTFNQIDRQDVGITLRITPQISSNDFVTLRIFTDVSDVVPNSNNELGPTTTVRSSETTVITKDAQMIVIGGLMSDQNNDSNAGVPYLKNIPVLGQLFRNSSESARRTNLLTFITPRIVKDQFDARDSTKEKTGVMKKTLNDENVYPRRKEILDNEHIDNVAEISAYNGEGPGTILPPKSIKKAKRLLSQQQNPSNQNTVMSITPKEESGSIDAEIDDTASFNLKRNDSKGENGQDTSLPQSQNLQNQQKAQALNQSSVAPVFSSQKETPNRSTKRNYIVLKVLKAPSFKIPTPFLINDEKYFGLVLPSVSTDETLSFFKPGQKYIYKIDNEKIVVEVVELNFSTKSKIALSEKYWYILSPYEILHLGQGPWFKQ